VNRLAQAGRADFHPNARSKVVPSGEPAIRRGLGFPGIANLTGVLSVSLLLKGAESRLGNLCNNVELRVDQFSDVVFDHRTQQDRYLIVI
jgi:hypothetical protein